jgi:outer membrane lipoprotein-sorting protein
LLALAPCAFAEPPSDLAAVEKAIEEAWANVGSLRAIVDIHYLIPGAPPSSVDGTATIECLRENGASLYKLHQESRVHIENYYEDVTSDTLYDGSFLYETLMRGEQLYTVREAPSLRSAPPPGGGPLLDLLKKDAEQTYAGEEEVMGRKAYVIVSKPKEGDSSGIAQYKHFFDEETGFCLKMVMNDESSPIYAVAVCKELTLNPKLDPAQFIFVLPAGSKLIDTFAGETFPSESPEPAPAPTQAPAPTSAPPAPAESTTVQTPQPAGAAGSAGNGAPGM